MVALSADEAILKLIDLLESFLGVITEPMVNSSGQTVVPVHTPDAWSTGLSDPSEIMEIFKDAHNGVKTVHTPTAASTGLSSSSDSTKVFTNDR